MGASQSPQIKEGQTLRHLQKTSGSHVRLSSEPPSDVQDNAFRSHNRFTGGLPSVETIRHLAKRATEETVHVLQVLRSRLHGPK